MVLSSQHPTSQEAWEWINEYLILNEVAVKKRGGIRSGNNVISYDHYMEINKLWVDPNFDFGEMFNYKENKWRTLVSNYIDFDFLDLAKSQVLVYEEKKSYNYTVGFKFSNKHSSGHGCLMTLIFSRRHSNDNPVITISIRSSEVTKRLLMDLVLVQRIAEYVYGKNQNASAIIYATQMYITAENFLMYNNHKDILKIVEGHDSTMANRVRSLVERFTGMTGEGIKYGVHRRVVNSFNKRTNSNLKVKNLRFKQVLLSEE